MRGLGQHDEQYFVSYINTIATALLAQAWTVGADRQRRLGIFFRLCVMGNRSLTRTARNEEDLTLLRTVHV